MRWARIPVVAMVLALVGCSAPGSGDGGGAPTPTGSAGGGVEVTGEVTASPAGPGPQRGTASTGTPLAGAVVILTAGGPTIARTTTGNDGRFRLVVPPGQYRITAVNPGIGSQASKEITVDRPVEVNLVVDSGLR